MLLAADVGNTNTVFALFEDTTARASWRLATVRQRTSDEYALALVQLIEMAGFDWRDIDEVVVSSVVPEADRQLRWMCRDRFDRPVSFVGEDVEVPLGIKLSNPKEIGADRLVNAYAAHRHHGGDLIVVDFGTATTFDVVDRAGTYHGGVIAPGINLSLEALNRAAAKLPRIGVEKPQAVIGDSTVSAMQSGVFWGYIGLIEGLVARIQAEFGEPMRTIGTGGLAPLFADATAAIARVDTDLTMTGLVDLFRLHQARRETCA
ncbi:MAG: type III pantothenate kinase [Alphaproteobacteria bacterium]|jgi:type III pantothenate kinase|nr:type III pantothenate kinase [Alphaproteobacteria bacterium]